MSPPRVLLYLLRRDLRIQDNKILTQISQAAKQSPPGFTHLLPLYVFHPGQLEVSGFLQDGAKSPFPEARSRVAQFWRCGPHRARWLAESVWDVKTSLEELQSTLELRVGRSGDVVKDVIEGLKREGNEVVGLWMHKDWVSEEKREEKDIREAVESLSVEFKCLDVDAYFIDDQDVPCKPAQIPDVFTQYKNKVMPLRDAPRAILPRVTSLPPPPKNIPPQADPFRIPKTFDDLLTVLQAPLQDLGVKDPPPYPKNAQTAHPFKGGEASGHDRIKHLLASGHMTSYKDTRNGMLGLDFSTKLSAWLAHGCITARQIHWAMYDFEDGKSNDPKMRNAAGFGKGESKGTAAVRFELLWRDYMQQCMRKFGTKLFRESGFADDTNTKWKYPQKGGKDDTSRAVERFLNGTTGLGLIDASQRELYLTGYTSNRARQNVASFLSKHLGIDWRIGAEWYESMLIDYDTSSNWGNWQYVAGVGNDPRGEARVFNPVKQAHDYDPGADYIKNWIEPLRKVSRPEHAMQPWTMDEGERRKCGLEDAEWVMNPLKKIEFRQGAGGGRGGGGYRGRGRGGGDRRGKRGGTGKGGRGERSGGGGQGGGMVY